MNNTRIVLVCYVLSFVLNIYGETNPYIEALNKYHWKSEQQYVEVRPGAHIFYWLYYADGKVKDAEQKPLVIWIQGGPGLAASGIANFAEIGPLTLDMQPRNHTWVKGNNVLLIDHPVGTGFSYATDNSLYVKTDREIATDLSRVIKSFLKRHKEFRDTPTYIFGQSYGGKITPRLGYYLHSAITRGVLKMNLKGIGIGSGWVHPKESIQVYPEYLYIMGAIDQNIYVKIKLIVKQIIKHLDKGEYELASKFDDLLFRTMAFDFESGTYINCNNIKQKSPYPSLDRLAININQYVKPTLNSTVNQSIVWSYLSDEVFNAIQGNSLMPSTKFLELLLNESKIKVAVYNGNLDVITPIAGAVNWVNKLNWYGAQEFRDAKRIQIKGDMNGFYKSAGQFSFWWVFESGHWVPEDNPVAMEHIMDYVMEKVH